MTYTSQYNFLSINLFVAIIFFTGTIGSLFYNETFLEMTISDIKQ